MEEATACGEAVTVKVVPMEGNDPRSSREIMSPTDATDEEIRPGTQHGGVFRTSGRVHHVGRTRG